MLRTGYTTGSCAAAAAKAAALALGGAGQVTAVEIPFPDGTRGTFPVLFARSSDAGAQAAVRKFAGDDPDVTDGAAVVVTVAREASGDVVFAAGEGVGTVTKPGLQVPPGEPAINPGPRAMIRAAVREATSDGVRITISIPGGRELAARTFNPRLGVQGGLSILGTTGRVRPFSVPALRDALVCALDVALACGIRSPVLVPGNIGERAARRHFRLTDEQVVHVSNEWGFMLERAAERPLERLLVVGHPGKLAKLADGEWDTHSSRSSSATDVVTRLAAGKALASAPSTLVPKAGYRPQPNCSPGARSPGLQDAPTERGDYRRRDEDASHILSEQSRPSSPDTPPLTVEGIFEAMDEDARLKLGASVAAAVRAAVQTRIPHPAAVVLVNMKGDLLGADGDVSPWQ